MLNHISLDCPDPELVPYAQKLSDLVNSSVNYPDGATRIYDHLYLAGYVEVTDHRLIQQLRISHVINCANKDVNTGHDFYKNHSTFRKYVGFDADDVDDYDIMQHYDDAERLIEEARLTNGCAIIHCQMGVNRSGALTVAYVMSRDQCGPLTAAEKVLNARQHILSNSSFQIQLLEWAKKRGLLDYDKDKIEKPAASK